MLAPVVLPSRAPFAAVLHGHTDGLHPGLLPDVDPANLGVDARWNPAGGDEATDPGTYDEISISIGDLTGDGYPDVAVGPSVFLGTDAGLGVRFTSWESEAPAVALPLSGGTHDWLVVGNASAKVGADKYAGEVSVLRSDASGAPGPASVWSQDSPGVKGVAERKDGFGWTVGTGQGRYGADAEG